MCKCHTCAACPQVEICDHRISRVSTDFDTTLPALLKKTALGYTVPPPPLFFMSNLLLLWEPVFSPPGVRTDTAGTCCIEKQSYSCDLYFYNQNGYPCGAGGLLRLLPAPGSPGFDFCRGVLHIYVFSTKARSNTSSDSAGACPWNTLRGADLST